MEPAVGELLNSPKLALPVERFGRILEEEQNKRDRFYDEANLREVQRIVQEE